MAALAASVTIVSGRCETRHTDVQSSVFISEGQELSLERQLLLGNGRLARNTKIPSGLRQGVTHSPSQQGTFISPHDRIFLPVSPITVTMLGDFIVTR